VGRPHGTPHGTGDAFTYVPAALVAGLSTSC